MKISPLFRFASNRIAVHGFRQFQPFSTLKDPLKAAPRSLHFDRSFDLARPEIQNSYFGKLMLTIFGYYTKQSQYRRGAQNLFEALQEKSTDSKFFKIMKLDREFPGIQAVLSLHMWLLIRRLKEVNGGKQVSQFLYDEFLEDVEDRLRKAGVKVRFNSLLEDLEKRFYGACFAYDDALSTTTSSKESLAEALVRNVYQREEKKLKAARRLEK
eukprot:g5583.t1